MGTKPRSKSTKSAGKKSGTKRQPRVAKLLNPTAEQLKKTYTDDFFKGKHLTTIHRIYKAQTGSTKSLEALKAEKNGSKRRTRTAMIKSIRGETGSRKKKEESKSGWHWNPSELSTPSSQA